MGDTMILSTLSKTWIFDIDGTLVKHNGYKLDGRDTLLEGAKEYSQHKRSARSSSVISCL